MSSSKPQFVNFQVIPIGQPIPAVSADYNSESSEDRLFNLFGGGNKPSFLPSKPSFNLFGGSKPGKGKPSYKPSSSRPKPSYGAPSVSKPSYKPRFESRPFNYITVHCRFNFIFRPSSSYGVPQAAPISSSYGVPQAPPIGYGVPQSPPINSNYKAPSTTSFVTPQNNNNNNLNGFTSQASYQSQKRPNRDSLRVNNKYLYLFKL